MNGHPVAEKANRVFMIIGIAFALILLRIWFLTIVCHEDYVTLSKQPQRKTIIEAPDRGTIRDRFNEPLAVNRMTYTVSICYDDLRHIPRSEWNKSEKKKIYPRKEHISALAKLFEKELGFEATYIEDLIYSKASLFPNTCYTIKEGLTEEQYFRLRALQKDWPGLRLDITAKRYYPYGPVGCNVVGYLGNIHTSEFLAIREQIDLYSGLLKEREEGSPIILPAGFHSWREVKERLEELKEKSYSINSQVGKSGIEKSFDEDLRGCFGKKKFEIDTQGRLVRQLPDSTQSTSGRRILLTISRELQEYAEILLADHERLRDERFRFAGKGHTDYAAPWIKGGGAVAMDPKTGEILCFASYPRYNPNDFSQWNESSKKQTSMWLESDDYINRLWEGEAPLKREFFKKEVGFYEEEKYLTWDLLLDYTLSLNSSVRKQLRFVKDIATASLLLNTAESISNLSQMPPSMWIDLLFPASKTHVLFNPAEGKKGTLQTHMANQEALLAEWKSVLQPYLEPISNNGDKLLFFDLLKLACPYQSLSDSLIEKFEEWTLSDFWLLHQKFLQMKRSFRHYLRNSFHQNLFSVWRENHFKDYLKEKRKWEKENKHYQKPYLDYLQEKEKEMFDHYVKENEHRFLLKLLHNHTDPIIYDFDHPYLSLFRSLFSEDHLETVYEYILSARLLPEMETKLWGEYKLLGNDATEQDLARFFYPKSGFGFLRSHAYQEPVALGSIFKIAVAYEAIKQSKQHHRDFNNLTIFDEIKTETYKNQGQILGYTADKKPITRLYKGGRLPKSHKSSGKIDLIQALEHSSNIYFSILASEVLDHPKDLYRVAKELSFGKRTGIDLPGENKGALPDDLADNKSGLYSFAIGQHAFTVTPLQTAVMMSSFSNGGQILKPQVVKTIANLEPEKHASPFDTTRFPYQQALRHVGIYFPFFTESQKRLEKPYLSSPKTKVMNQIHLDKDVEKYLIHALHRVMNNKEGGGRASTIRYLFENPDMKRNYINIQPYMIGKTGTAEIVFRPTLDRNAPKIMAQNIWFAGTFYEDKELTKPEVVVIVYLKYGDWGKEAMPIATEIANKWREIKKKHLEH